MKQDRTKSKKDHIRSRDSSGERFLRLAVMGEQLFHTGDLANLWNIRNSSTLHMTLARYVTQGLLYRIHKGFYSIKNPTELNPYYIGLKALHSPAYISCETVLFEAGIINQPPQAISIVSNKSCHFTLVENQYRSRQLADSFLYNDIGIETKNDIRVATLSRAVADMLYFNPKKHFDITSEIPWDEVRRIVRVLGYPVSSMKQYDAFK